MRTVFINPERCIGCLQCEFACATEHSRSQDEVLAFLETPVPRKRIHVQPGPMATVSYPNKCQHCDPAPCMRVCPAGAITRDDGTGSVLVEAQRCIGCAMCAVVCPFDVLTFHPLPDGPNPDTAVAVKCDGCVDRVRAGQEPACVEVCKVDALVYGELNDLIADGRLREAGAVLAATAGTPIPPPGGDPLAGWHAWGEAELAAAEAAAVGTGSGNGSRPAAGVSEGERS
ncbi:MAG TPA: 4Fe-4S dicluster domain-containing protein [Pseudonocardiaceae bacterium]